MYFAVVVSRPARVESLLMAYGMWLMPRIVFPSPVSLKLYIMTLTYSLGSHR